MQHPAVMVSVVQTVPLQPPDKALQCVNHCLVKSLPFNQLPFIQVLSSHQMAAVLETMKGEDRYFLNQPFFRVSPLQMQVEKAYGLFPVRPVQGKY